MRPTPKTLAPVLAVSLSLTLAACGGSSYSSSSTASTNAAASTASSSAPAASSAGGGSVSGLESVKRPDGAEQLAYKGEPLYTFAGDKAAGEANGQGIKADGGVWMAVTTGAASTESSSGGSSGYGY